MKRQTILLTLMTLFMLTLSACANPYEARTPISHRSGSAQTANLPVGSGNATQQDAVPDGFIGQRNPRAANNSYSTTGTVLPTAQEVQAARSSTPNQYGNRRALGRGFGFPNVPATTLNTEDDPLR